MDEQTIRQFRETAIAYFEPILTKEGYDLERARELAFLVAKVLEDALPLLVDIDTLNQNTDQVIDNIHMLYTNKHAFDDGAKILMLKK